MISWTAPGSLRLFAVYAKERRPLTSNEDQNREPERIGRREFIGTSGTIAAAAATWWAVTEKTDALAQGQSQELGPGGDPNNQDYHYDEG